LNSVALCNGSETSCGIPAGVAPCGDGLWWARIANPFMPDPLYRCVTRYPVNMSIPGMVRWRWLASDEGEWMRCPQGCCELTGEN
jgi:hypothetical protein